MWGAILLPAPHVLRRREGEGGDEGDGSFAAAEMMGLGFCKEVAVIGLLGNTGLIVPYLEC